MIDTITQFSYDMVKQDPAYEAIMNFDAYASHKREKMGRWVDVHSCDWATWWAYKDAASQLAQAIGLAVPVWVNPDTGKFEKYCCIN
jgi:hypothetical protein